MANTRLLFLSEQEEDLIHSQSLRLLDEMGVLVRSKSVLQLLEGKGAIVDYDAMTARMPAEMIDSALDTAPREMTLFPMTLCARAPMNMKIAARTASVRTLTRKRVKVESRYRGGRNRMKRFVEALKSQ